MPSTGRLSLDSTSWVLLKVLLSISSSRLRPMPAIRASAPANATIRPRWGVTGSVGSAARSTTRALAESRSEVAAVSFRRVMKVSYRVRLPSTSRISSRTLNSLRDIFWICALLVSTEARSELSLATANW
ncbi:hypothetical protein D3C80_1736720 [compost metagenome]